MYTIDNLDYTIQTQISQLQSLNPTPKLFEININQNKVINEKLSSQIKYRLEIYSISRGKLGTNLLAFQLMNN